MRREYILTLDQSTTSSKAMVVNREGAVIVRAAKEHSQHYPAPGWVEHDPLEIYARAKTVLQEALQRADLQPGDLAALALTNQRETVVVWDKETGMPVHNAIVWQCRRTADLCAELKEKGFAGVVREKTGLLLDPYFSATKIRWILDHVPGAAEKARSKRLLCGTVDSWLIWKLTGGKTHVTDFTNASRTMLFNIRTLQWDEELLELFSIPRDMLPAVISSDEIAGYTTAGELFEQSLPIAGVIGDSQGALFGQKCFRAGEIKATYGTGSSILMNVGRDCLQAGHGLVTSIAWGLGGQVEYALEGIIHCTGDALKWVRECLGLFENFEQVPVMVNSLEGNDGVYLVPAFVGLGIPYWDSGARAAIVGLSRSSGKAHIIRAAVESIAYQIRDAIDIMERESGVRPQLLRVDGGATSNPFMMQFQADILNLPLVRSEIAELSSLGSAYLAGLAVGLWESKEQIIDLNREEYEYTPSMDPVERESLYLGWHDAVRRVLTGQVSPGCCRD